MREPDRWGNKKRNIIINRCVDDLDVIINLHDSEIDPPIADGVWDRLDGMASEIEALYSLERQSDGRLTLNLSAWIERRADAVGPYADHIIHSVKAYEDEIKRLMASGEERTGSGGG